jgi:hypothetical protein
VSGEGAYIVLTREDAKRLFAQKEDEAIRGIVEELRQSSKHRDEGFVLECGAAWDPIHRSLTEGMLDPDAGEFPLDHCVLGGRRLHQSSEFDAILIRPDIVPHVTAALQDLKREEFHANYMALDPDDYGKPPTETEFDEVWGTLKLIRQFFEGASNEHAAIVFTVER